MKKKDKHIKTYELPKIVTGVNLKTYPGKIKQSIKINHKIPQNATLEDYQEYIRTIGQLPVEELVLAKNAAMKKSNVQKGIARGIKFDSKWELAYYIYKKEIEGVPIERNQAEWLPYISANGQQKKFYPDFKCYGHYIEIKGRFRENDIRKQEQCQNVEFITSVEMGPIIKIVNERFPNWEKEYLPRN